MTDERKPAGTRVHCRRTGQEYDTREHGRCPYCFGSQRDIASGKHERFCDFEPGIDPIHFGFPEDSSRNQRT